MERRIVIRRLCCVYDAVVKSERNDIRSIYENAGDEEAEVDEHANNNNVFDETPYPADGVESENDLESCIEQHEYDEYTGYITDRLPHEIDSLSTIDECFDIEG